jgi:DNA-binding NtrC family response regulator
LAEHYTITLDDLPENLTSTLPLGETVAAADPKSLREVERRYVRDVLLQENGNKVHAARVLGISRRALYRLIEKYHLKERET